MHLHPLAQRRAALALLLTAAACFGCGDESSSGEGGPNLLDTYMSVTLDDGRTLRLGTLAGQGALGTSAGRSFGDCFGANAPPQCLSLRTSVVDFDSGTTLGISLHGTSTNTPPTLDDQKALLQTGPRDYLAPIDDLDGVVVEVNLDETLWSTRNVAQPEGASFRIDNARRAGVLTESEDGVSGERWSIYAVFTGRLANDAGETIDITTGELNLGLDIIPMESRAP